jgi:molybdate-binding protein
MDKDFAQMAKEQYDLLLKQKTEIDAQIAPLKKYLESAGILKKKPRGRKPAKEEV